MARPPHDSSLRRSLAACTSEGIVAEAVAACSGGAVATAWALHLGGGARTVALLGALPFLAQLCQPAGAWLTSRLGARRAALVTAALSRQAFLPLVLLPWCGASADRARALLVACCAAHHALGILCNNAWVTWVADLVPGRLRGSYFGRRTAVLTFASAVGTLAIGVGLDGARAASLTGPALAMLALLTSVAGAASVVLMARQRGGARSGLELRWSPRAAMAPLGDRRARRLGAYLVLWNGAIGFSAPFYGLYVLQDLHGGFGALAGLTAGAALARTATAPAWGRLVDRVGAGRVLAVCTAGLTGMPLVWVAAARLGPWTLAVDAVVGGALLGGHGVASFTLPLSLAPARERPHWHAALSMAGGAAFGAASACGGELVSIAPRLLGGSAGPVLPAHLTFAASFAVRAAAAGASLAVLDGRYGACGSSAWIAARRQASRVAGALRVRGAVS